MVGRQNMFLCSRYWRKVKIWSIQPCPGLNPACYSRIWFSLAGVSLCRVIETSSLVMTGVRLIPLWSSHTIFLPFLKIGITVDSPQLSGTDSDCQILSNNWVITLMRVTLPVLNSTDGRSFGPAALNRLIASLNSVSVGGSLDTVQTEIGSMFWWESGWDCWQFEKCDWKCSSHLSNRRSWLEIKEPSFSSIALDTFIPLELVYRINWNSFALFPEAAADSISSVFRSHQFSRSWRRVFFISRPSFRRSCAYRIPGAILQCLQIKFTE